LGRQLGKGGQAVVYDLPELDLPDVTGPLVYKEYRSGHTPFGGLSSVVAVRNRLDPTTQARLDEIAAWPVRIVTDEDGVTGVVMPRIPDTFFDEVLLPGSGSLERTVREIQHLFIDPARAKHLGRPTPSPEERLAVCRDVASGLSFLHEELGVVFGDVNAKNVLFRLDVEPMTMFVDCDAVRIAGSAAVVAQLNAPDWEPPEGGPLSRATDLYKLGLLVLRCLVPGHLGSLNRDPATAAQVLDATGMDLLLRALGSDSRERPTAAEWHRHLCRELGQSVDPPRLSTVGLDRTVVAAGEPLLVRWTAEDATTVEVLAPGADPVRVDGKSGSGSVRVYPTRSGRLEISAHNALGSDRASAGPIAVVGLPTTQTLPVPVPSLTWPDLHLGAGAPVELPPLPMVRDDIAIPLAAQAFASPSAQPSLAAPPPPPLADFFAADLSRSAASLHGDILSIMTSAVPFDVAPSARGEAVR
jgi:hypothetical protein